MPKPQEKNDFHIRAWEYEMVEVYGACLRMHRDCVRWNIKERTK